MTCSATFPLARCCLIAGTAALANMAWTADLTSFERQLIGLPANTWLEVPNTRLADVCAPGSFGVAGKIGCSGVTDAWSGGAYGRGPRKMFVWGGGHNDYWGNEVYAFDLRSGRWQRLTDPSPGALVSAANGDPLPDGRPNSRHTYDGLQFIERAGLLFAQGGSVSPGGGKTALTWLFDPITLNWRNDGNIGGPSDYGMASAYDSSSGTVLLRSTKALWRYKSDEGKWVRLADFGASPLWPRYEVSGNKRAAIDTKRRLFWSVGNNDFLVWDLENGKLVSDGWITRGGGDYSNEARLGRHPGQALRSGGGDIYNASAPGFDYDRKADQFVAWKGGSPYILELASRTWRTGSAAGAPATQARNGTYGRWRYVPEYNVFILVNGVTSNVFFYKNTPGGP